jgi:hypothetical protein
VTALPLDENGNATAYVMATGPGVATLVATASSPAATAHGDIEFVAPLTAGATITLLVDPAVIGSNATTVDTEQQSTLRAVVRDGTPQNNRVKNAVVNFSIITDPSGGYLTQPSVVATGSDGAATVSYVAGSGSSATNGVVLQAQIQSTITTRSTTAALTVARRALFVSAGTGNTVNVNDPESYSTDYLVFVTDAGGNAVSGANITASVLPSHYDKGFQVYSLAGISWVKMLMAHCLNEDLNANGILDDNEDLNLNGILDAGEDLNHNNILDHGEDTNANGRLEPGIPLTVTSTGQTDASGTARVTLQYPRNRARWLEVDLTIRASVGGSESSYKAHFVLIGAAIDYATQGVSPPGQFSPYGTGPACTDTN